MVALKLRPVKLVQNRRRVIRIPKSDILLRRTVQHAVRKSRHRRIRDGSLQLLELRGGKKGAVRNIGHMLCRAWNAPIRGVLQYQSRTARRAMGCDQNLDSTIEQAVGID